jgi:hypothetical protein
VLDVRGAAERPGEVQDLLPRLHRGKKASGGADGLEDQLDGAGLGVGADEGEGEALALLMHAQDHELTRLAPPRDLRRMDKKLPRLRRDLFFADDLIHAASPHATPRAGTAFARTKREWHYTPSSTRRQHYQRLREAVAGG